MTVNRHTAISLQDAVDRAPTLARLSQLVAESSLRLQIVQPTLPPGLRTLVRAGPIDEGQWCLLVPHNPAAAKLRQLLPALQATLQAAGHPVGTIRIKVERAGG
jgi:hypothetical protein